MKLNKYKKLKYPNLELQIYKLYSKKKDFNPKIEIKLTEILLNKIANIIYLYHVSNKTILFLGFPNSLTKILKTTKHINVPEYMWQNNMFRFSNNNNNSKTKTPKNIFKLQTKLKKKVDLIVINNLEINMNAFKESYLARIPAITITKKLDFSKTKLNYYNSTGSYHLITEKKNNVNFIYLFIKTILLKAKKEKQKM
jgi:hypothetical protein